MATIVFASSKGGVGKTTAAMTLAFVTAHHGAATTLIDGDPNRPIARWAERFPGNVPANLHIVEALGDSVMDAIDGSSMPWTIVDLEGSKNQEVSVGIGRADLVLIPLSGTRLDADEASAVIRVIRRQELAWRRPIPFRLLFTRMSPTILNRQTKDILAQFKDGDVPTIGAWLYERAAYQATFHVGPTLYDLTDKDASRPAVAIENAEAVAAEVRDILAEVLA